MSLSSIKNKSAKGKRKTLPKLKTILANPYKLKCSSLDQTEIENFFQILDSAIRNSGLTPCCFVKAKHICVGLESVLRSINSGRVSCVFLSLSIKPHHVVQLVAQNVEVKSASAPVYAVSQLEQQTFKFFGLRTAAFSLPQGTEDLCTELKDWIDTHKKSIKKKVKSDVIKRRTVKKLKDRVMKEDKINNVKILKNVPPEKKPDWSGDFISFSSLSNSKKKVDLNLEEDKTKLLGVLSQMTKDVQISSVEGNLAMDKMNLVEVLEKNVASIQNYDSDKFLESYKPLKVHTILPNPDKKPKKKRKNKK